MSATHANTIVVNIFITPTPVAQTQFRVPLLLVDEDSTDGNSLNGERQVLYGSLSDATAANTAGYIDATTLAFAAAAFAQTPTLQGLRVGKVQTGAPESETYAAGLAAVEALTDDFYAVCIDSRVSADIAAVAAAVEATGKRLFVAQSADATWKTSGLPTGLTALANLARTAVVYHDVAAEPADLAYVASQVAWNLNETSTPWEAVLAGINGLSTPLTDAEYTLLLGNNANLVTPLSSSSAFMSPGNLQNGRAIYTTVTADWFTAELRARIANLRVRYAQRGRKLIVGAGGQAAARAELEYLLQLGEDIGHFKAGQTAVTAPAVTVADETARQVRLSAAAQSAEHAVNFQFNVTVQNTPVNA